MYHIANFEKQKELSQKQRNLIAGGTIVGVGALNLAGIAISRGRSKKIAREYDAFMDDFYNEINPPQPKPKKMSEKDVALEEIEKAKEVNVRYQPMSREEGVDAAKTFLPFVDRKFKYFPSTRTKVVGNRANKIREGVYDELSLDLKIDKISPEDALSMINDKRLLRGRLKEKGKRLRGIDNLENKDLYRDFNVKTREEVGVGGKFNNNMKYIANFEKKKNQASIL
jgi:hypothetical protein